MARQGKATAVPRLRFPEFLDSPGWRFEPLSTFVSALDAGVSVNAGDRPATSTEIGVLKTSCVTNGVFELSENKVVLEPGEQTRVTERVRGDTIIISRMNTTALVGANAYVENDAANVFLPDRLWAAKPAPDTNMRFMAYILGSDRRRGALSELAAGSSGSMKNIAKPAVLKMLISAPKSDEQKKIADCLTSLDQIIAAQGRKIEALKAYKRGLMQQLLPRVGETLPSLRFPEFSRSSGWHSQKISSLLSKASNPVSVNPESMYREIGIRSHGKGVFHKEPVQGKVIGDKRVFSVVVDALVLNIVFAWEQAVATTSKAEVGMIASHRFPMYVAKSEKCDVRYVKEYFLTQGGKHLLAVASPGGAGRNKTLGQTEFEALEISLPISVDEQMRIANCLSTADTEIVVESEKLNVLKTHKQGLMQQLFPAPESAST